MKDDENPVHYELLLNIIYRVETLILTDPKPTDRAWTNFLFFLNGKSILAF